jgi:hypothetical protein
MLCDNIVDSAVDDFVTPDDITSYDHSALTFDAHASATGSLFLWLAGLLGRNAVGVLR